MESILKHKILKHRSNTMLELRKLYNLDNLKHMNEAIDLLDDWVKKHGYILKKNYSRSYLERAITLRKGSVERAKSCIESLCTLKTILPSYFDKFDAKKDYEYMKNTINIIALPNLTEDNYRVILMKLWNNNFTSSVFLDSYKFCGLLCEHLCANDYAAGGIIVIDDRDVAISHILSSLNLVHLGHATTILMKGFGFRIKGIHFISLSKRIEILIKTVKRVISKKISNRIFGHSGLESLYEHIPKEILPQELNGNEKPINILFDEWLDLLSTKENVKYFEEMFTEAVVDKSYRQVQEFNETFQGLDGTFRTLSVD